MNYANHNNGIKNIYKILFICFVVLGLYYPSLFSQFNSIDDSHIISYLENTNSSLLDIFMPGKSHYYRPVIWLTFFFDKYVWGLEPSFMHLENIVIHAVNAVLVYQIVKRIAGVDEHRLELPILSALLFAVHPINTEAVCWVAGRTDLLATMFILTAAFYLADTRIPDNINELLVPAGCIFLGCLAKEVAFFFFPVAGLVALHKYYSLHSGRGSSLKWWDLARPALPFVFFPLVYLYLRQVALTADNSVSILLSQKTSVMKMAVAGLKAFGFYVKKLFMPFPLNFAIVSYSDRYVWLGIAVLILLCWMLWKRRSYYFILCSSLFLILPAVLVAVKPIAWTPVAERYLYAPAAIFAIAIVGILFYLFRIFKQEHLLPLILIGLIIVCSFTTVQRNLVWQDNYLLYKDAVVKSPQFARIRNEFGIALAERGNNTEASNQFEAGKNIDKNYKLPILNLATIKFREGKNQEAIDILTKSFKEKKSADCQILKLLAKVYENNLLLVKNSAEQNRIVLDLIDTYQYIYAMEKDPYIAYRGGQLLLSVGNPQQAAILFEKASIDAPDDAYYKQAAKKLAEKLRNKSGR